MIQIIVFAVLLVVAAAAVFTLDSYQRGQINAQTRSNQLIQNRIERIRRQIRDHDQIRERIEEIESKQGVINELLAGRTGPVFVMVELAKVMSRSGSPTIDHDRYMDLVRRSPGQAYDPSWDGRRIWLQSFREENREVELSGSAMNHEDVAEFLRRLSLSDFFFEVVLVQTRTQSSDDELWTSPLVSFEVRCRLRYSGRPPAVESEESDEESGA